MYSIEVSQCVSLALGRRHVEAAWECGAIFIIIIVKLFHKKVTAGEMRPYDVSFITVIYLMLPARFIFGDDAALYDAMRARWWRLPTFIVIGKGATRLSSETMRRLCIDGHEAYRNGSHGNFHDKPSCEPRLFHNQCHLTLNTRKEMKAMTFTCQAIRLPNLSPCHILEALNNVRTMRNGISEGHQGEIIA